MPMKNNKRITISLNSLISEWLKECAEKNGCSQNELINALLGESKIRYGYNFKVNIETRIIAGNNPRQNYVSFLREELKTKNISCTKLAKNMGVTRQYVHNYLYQDRNPTYKTVERFRSGIELCLKEKEDVK